jgi:hypothetical protein
LCDGASVAVDETARGGRLDGADAPRRGPAREIRAVAADNGPTSTVHPFPARNRPIWAARTGAWIDKQHSRFEKARADWVASNSGQRDFKRRVSPPHQKDAVDGAVRPAWILQDAHHRPAAPPGQCETVRRQASRSLCGRRPARWPYCSLPAKQYRGSAAARPPVRLGGSAAPARLGLPPSICLATIALTPAAARNRLLLGDGRLVGSRRCA